jgi:hypothetical protein
MAAKELSEIREMRKELKQLDATLMRLEALYQRPNPDGSQLWRLEQMAMKDWILSLVESCVTITYKPGVAGNYEVTFGFLMKLNDVCQKTYNKLQQQYRDDR